MIEKAIRFDEGGSTDSGSGDGAGDSNQSAAESARLANYESAASDASGDSAPSYNWGTIGAPLTGAQLAGGTEAAAVPALAGVEGYNPDGFAGPDGTSLGAGYDTSKVGGVGETSGNWSTWDNISEALPSLSTIGNVASIFMPALRAPMMLANAAQSINNDSSPQNIAGTLLAAPLSKAIGLAPSTVASLFKGDVGSAVANQAVGSAYGDVGKALGTQAAPMLGLANSLTGATGEAKKALAGEINRALNDQSQSTNPAAPSGGTAFASGDSSPTPSQVTSHSSPISTSIASILGVPAPAPTAARAKQTPIDIVQQLMAMQNPTGNLKSTRASTGGSIDDLIRLTRS
jgi:hypothetical protein